MSGVVKVNDFMNGLSVELQKDRKDGDKEKPGITESSATLYIKTLYKINGDKPFKSLAFLKNTAGIDDYITHYSPNTAKTILGAVVGVLTLKKLKGYTKALNHYREKLGIRAKELREQEGTNTKTDKQEKNWVAMDDINKMKEERWKELSGKIGNKAKLSPELYKSLMSYLIVSLYTDMSPRRNQDYLKMLVVKTYNEKMDDSANYCDLKNKRFVFNVYKTAKKYGRHYVDWTAEVEPVLKRYLKYHPGKARFGEGEPLLVEADGKPLTAVNAITRVLNKWFGKNIGSSMLRHIYLSSKYNIDEMKKDALDMGHSVEQQKGYMKSDTAE